MDKERWNDINRIFHAALEVDSGRRQAVVLAEAGGDSELRAEVELLLQADSAAGSYLESPVVSAAALAAAGSPLVPGEVLCGRFRIVREIAEGGMGHVFEAFDSEIAVSVALKVIRPEIASAPEALARFRQEVRLARSITHPNICRTYDLEREVRTVNGRQTELVFLTMELLHGETLAARIKRSGTLPLAEALGIARQIAAALQAAHALGVVHRDMKPANIMLVAGERQQTPRAVVTDFGLARLDPLQIVGDLSSYTHTGTPIGTLAYMAPEQLEGAPVSSATDVYAFGLVLCEMVTGKRVFPSNNLLSGIAQRLNGALPLEQMLGPDVPANWANAIRQSLQVKPQDRPHDANEVVRMVEDDKHRFPSLRRRAVKSSASWWPRIRAAVAVTLLVVALFAGGFRLYQAKAGPGVAPGSLVYLTQVKNQTGEKSFDNITELIQAGLSQSIQVNLLDQGRVGDILQQMTKSPDVSIDPAIAREVAMRAGASRVIFATVTGKAGKYSLDIDVQQPDATPSRYREHWTRSFSWQMPPSAAALNTIPTELLTQVRSASNWIRHEAGESANDIARLDTPPEDVTTDSWDALAAYLRGVRLDQENKSADAVIALREAIRLDPKFALAYGKLADIQLTLHQEPEGFENYKKALDPGLERRLSRRERDRIEGMYAVDSQDFPAAVDAFRDYETFYPNDKLGWMYPTYPLMMLGRDSEIAANLDRVLALDPQNAFALNSKIDIYLAQGNLAEARTALAHSQQVGITSSTTARAGALAFLGGNYEEATSQFSRLKQSPVLRLRSRGYEMLAAVSAERGDYAAALRILEEGMKEDISEGNPAAQSGKLAGRAWMKAQLGDFTGCASDLREAVKLNPSPELILNVETILGQAIQLAPAAAAQSLRQQMIELANNLPKGDYGTITRLLTRRSHAEAQLASGDITGALQQFRDLPAMDAPVAPREYLGRALTIAAAAERNPQRSQALRREAMQAYAAVALHPGIVWVSAYTYPPGFLASELQSYVHLADLAGDSSPDILAARTRLASLRSKKAE